jgi:hypothetical protein
VYMRAAAGHFARHGNVPAGTICHHVCQKSERRKGGKMVLVSRLSYTIL